jgi:Cu-processing system permease protein
MEARVVVALLRKEINDSLNNRWFILYALVFAGLALLLSWLSLSSGGIGYSGFASFGRTAASLINLVLLIVPLMALTVGSGSMAGERERGTLHYLLSQPVNRAEVLLGKYLGLSASLLGALALGFGLSGLVIATQGRGADAGAYGTLAAFAFALALGMLSLGFIGDLGLMGTALAFKLPIGTIFHLALINPLQVFKMYSLISINATLDVLGPAGIYAMQTYRESLGWLFLGALVAWIFLPLALSFAVFYRRGDV